MLKRKLSRALSWVLTLAMVLTLLPVVTVPAMAAGTTTGTVPGDSETLNTIITGSSIPGKPSAP